MNENETSYVRGHFKGHMPALRAYAKILTRNPNLIDDLVQETLLKAFRYDYLFRGGNLRAWLLTIEHNIYVNWVRHWKRQPQWVGLELCNHTVDGHHDLQLWVEDVGDMLASLPEEMQEAIKLCAIDGMIYEDAAEKAQVPVGTMRSRLSRGRSDMRYLREKRS